MFTKIIYRKVPKFSDTRKLGCNLPKIQTKSPNLRLFSQEDANGIANSEDPDSRSSLNWVCTVCPDLTVQKLMTITVHIVLKLINLSYCLFSSFRNIFFSLSYFIFCL